MILIRPKIPHSLRDFLIYSYMNKFFGKLCDGVSDVAVVVGSAVGVGLISGKETQIFVCSPFNAAVFAVAFCCILSVFREFCRKNSVCDVSRLAAVCFGRFAPVFNVAVCTCAFVCVVTCLAGVEQCLSSMLYLSNVPLYAVGVAVLGALIMAKGMSALKVCNVISVATAVILFVLLAFVNEPSTFSTDAPMPYMPVLYALFNFTMSLSLTCKLGARTGARSNFARSAAASLTIAAMLVATVFIADFDKPLPTLTNVTNPYLKVYATLTVALACTCGIVGCAIPVCEFVNAVIGDETLTSAVVFGFACTFSMFGFDFLVRFGYLLVALVGAVILVAIPVSSLCRQR